MAMGPLERNTALVERVMMSKWGCLLAMGPLKRNTTLAVRLRMSKWGWLMATRLLKEQESGWEGQDV